MYKFFSGIMAAIIFFSSGLAHAHEYEGSSFVMSHPFAYPSQAGQTLLPVYLRFLSLTGPDKLIGVECRYADTAEFRSNQNLQADAIPFIAISPEQSFDINNPDTPHILLKGIRLPFENMRYYDMKLIFEKSGAIDLTVAVGI
jgi:hypothetical protein